MPRKPNPERIDVGTPEAIDAWLAHARPAEHVVTEIFGDEAIQEMLKPKRGKPIFLRPKELDRLPSNRLVLATFVC